MNNIYRLSCSFLLILIYSFFCHSIVYAGIKDSVIRLDSISKSKGENDIDEKILKAISIIDEMKEDRKWGEIKKIINRKDFIYSKYYDEVIYIYNAHLTNEKKYNELNKFWDEMSALQNSVHLLPAMLTRFFAAEESMKTAGYNRLFYDRELQQIATFIKIAPSELKIHGPMIEGNVLFGYKVKEDFSSGKLPKMFSINEYVESPFPLEGFSNGADFIYVLEKLTAKNPYEYKRGRLNRELKEGGYLEHLAKLYEKGGEREKAARIYYKISSIFHSEKDFEISDYYIKKSLENEPDNKRSIELKKQIDLALLLNANPASSLDENFDIRADCDDSFFMPQGGRFLTKSMLIGKNKKELRLIRNEIFARYGRVFKSEDLKQYFSKKCWYEINNDYNDNLLSEIDRRNVSLIKSIEDMK